jgi:hypothetical protein
MPVGYDISPLKRVKFKILTTSRQASPFTEIFRKVYGCEIFGSFVNKKLCVQEQFRNVYGCFVNKVPKLVAKNINDFRLTKGENIVFMTSSVLFFIHQFVKKS